MEKEKGGKKIGKRNLKPLELEDIVKVFCHVDLKHLESFPINALDSSNAVYGLYNREEKRIYISDEQSFPDMTDTVVYECACAHSDLNYLSWNAKEIAIVTELTMAKHFEPDRTQQVSPEQEDTSENIYEDLYHQYMENRDIKKDLPDSL